MTDVREYIRKKGTGNTKTMHFQIGLTFNWLEDFAWSVQRSLGLNFTDNMGILSRQIYKSNQR